MVEPKLVEEYFRELHTETKRLRQREASRRHVQERTLQRIRKQIRAIIDAVKEGMRTPGTKEELEALEDEREKLEKQQAVSYLDNGSTVDFHPALPALYRRKVEEF